MGYHNKSKVVDEDEEFFGPDRVKRRLSSFEVGDNLFHNCDGEGGTAGTPSAFVVQGEAGNPFLHCFACGISFFVMRVHNPTLYKCKRKILEEPGAKMTLLPNMFHGRFTVLDAPCGAGKTHNTGNFIRLLKETSCLSPTFRQSLAVTLSSQFSLECYIQTRKRERLGRAPQPPGGPEEGAVDNSRETTNLLWDRTTVCLNSVCHIPKAILERPTPYEIVIVDEADMLRTHFCCKYMSVVAKKTMELLREILVKAKTVIIMQYSLSEHAVEFYTTLRGIDLYDPSIHSIWYVV